ncbi:MAG: HEPN domain-containing protein [Bacillota bacterium]
MSVDDQRFAEMKAWLAKAAMDLRAAEVARSADPPVTSDIVFHAQQMVEKALKAFLAWHDKPFRKTHSLVELGEQCAQLAPDMEPLFRKGAPLTEYAWKFRYPGEPEEPSLEEAEQALGTAREVYEGIRARLPCESPSSQPPSPQRAFPTGGEPGQPPM